MPNLDLENKNLKISDDKVRNYLGKDTITGNDLTTTISRLKSDSNTEESEYILNYLNGLNKKEVGKIDAGKRIVMDTEGVGKKKGGNAFKDTHDKDKDNANPTKVGGLAKLTSSGEHSKVSDQINNNKVSYYESYNKELNSIKHLIEYMNKDNKNKI
jgi:hypothetical protein